MVRAQDTGSILAVGYDTFDTSVGDQSPKNQTSQLYSDLKWTITGAPAVTRQFYDLTPLPGGKAAIIGGYNSNISAALRDVEFYSTASNSWSAAAPLQIARVLPGVASLGAGRILVASSGGSYYTPGTDPAAYRSTEMFDPLLNSWKFVGNLSSPARGGRAIALPSGDVLFTGTSSGSYNSSAFPLGLPVSETYSQLTATWSKTSLPSVPRTDPLLVLLPSGEVLMVGGTDPVFQYRNTTFPSEIYSPPLRSWRTAAAPLSPRLIASQSQSVSLQNGTIFIVPLQGDYPELYDPVKDSFEYGATLPPSILTVEQSIGGVAIV